MHRTSTVKTSRIQDDGKENEAVGYLQNSNWNEVLDEAANKFVKRIFLLMNNFTNESTSMRSKRSATEGTLNPPKSGNQINKLENEIKKIKNIIEDLKKIDPNNQDEKKSFATLEASLEILQKQLDDLKLKADEKSESVDKSLENIINVLSDFRKEIEDLKNENKDRESDEKQKQLVEECISDLRAHRFTAARDKLRSITRDSDINHIVKTVYDAKENNLQLILDFVQDTDDYNRRVLVYKALKYEMETNHHRNPFNVIRIMKALKEVTKNKSFKISDSVILENIENLLEYYQLLLKEEMKESFKNQSKMNKQLINELFEFDREIWIDVMRGFIFEENQSNNEDNIKYVSKLASVEQILTGIEVIVSDMKTNNILNINAETIIPLINLHLVISSLFDRIDYWNLAEDDRTKIKLLNEQLASINTRLERDLKSCLIKNDLSSITRVINKLFTYKKNTFRDLLTKIIPELLKLIEPNVLMDRMYKFFYAEQVIFGFFAVFPTNKKTNANNNLDSKIIIKLKLYLNNYIRMNGQSSISPQLMIDIESYFSDILQGYMSYIDKYKKEIMQHSFSTELQHQADKLLSSSQEEFMYVLDNTIDAVYTSVNLVTLLNFVQHHQTYVQQLLGQVVVLNMMNYHGDLNNPFIFQLAYAMHIKKHKKAYNQLSSETQSLFENSIQSLPKSVKNMIFASEICIKNVNEDKYFHLNILNANLNNRKTNVDLFDDLPVHEKRLTMIVYPLKISNITTLHMGYITSILTNTPGCLKLFDHDIGYRPMFGRSIYEYKHFKEQPTWASFKNINLINMISVRGVRESITFSLRCPWIIEPKDDYFRVQYVNYINYPFTNESYTLNTDLVVKTELSCSNNASLCELWDIQDCSNPRRKRQTLKDFEKIHKHDDKIDSNDHHQRSRSLLTAGNIADNISKQRKFSLYDRLNHYNAIHSLNNDSGINSCLKKIYSIADYIQMKCMSRVQLENSTSAPSFVNAMDVNSSLMLLDLFTRKQTRQKYVVTKQTSINFQQIQADALNILDEFRQLVRSTARQYKIPITIPDLFELHLAITDSLRRNQPHQVHDLLHTAVDELYGSLTEYRHFVDDLHKHIVQLYKM